MGDERAKKRGVKPSTLIVHEGVQVRARAILAKRKGVKLEDVEWRIGNMHDLRKSFGTHMAKHVSMPELQRLMGHASITTTADHYVDLSDDVNEKVLAAFKVTA